jgi:Domain of unknown function (DUF4386)
MTQAGIQRQFYQLNVMDKSSTYSNKKIARIAGAVYLVVVLTGTFSLGYVPSKLIVSDNAALTFQNISNSEMLFRLHIVSAIICYTAFLILPFVLYRLLNFVNKNMAIGMVALAVVSVPILLINWNHKMAVLTIMESADYLNVFDRSSLQAQVLLQLNYYSNGTEIASVFWGLWLLPFGYLVFRSGILPKILGVFLIAGCFGYLINFVGNFLFQSYADLSISNYVSLPASIGEIGICLWLLIMGAKEKLNAQQ